MPDFSRLPPHLRVVSLLGLVCLLASFFLFWNLFITFLRSLSADSWHMLMMAVNLFFLGGTCFTIIRLYRIRLRMPQSDGGPFPLSGWKSQVAVIVSWTALPLSALAVAGFIPPTSDAFGLVFPATMLAGIVFFISLILATVSSGWIRASGAG